MLIFGIKELKHDTMTKTIISPAPVQLQTPEVYDRWIDGEDLHVILTDGRKLTVNFPDNFQPSGTLAVLDGYFLVEDEGFYPWEASDQFKLSFVDHMDQAITDEDILFALGLVARFSVRVKAAIKDCYGFPMASKTIYAANAAEAAIFAARYLPGQMLCVSAPTRVRKAAKYKWYQ